VAVTFILCTPRAAHAIAATLVQITNTTSNPAIAQDVSKLASQNVMLISNPAIISSGPEAQTVTPSHSAVLYQMFPNGTFGASPFVVPAGENLVVTAIDLCLEGSFAGVGIGNVANPSLREQFQITASAQFQFPNGIVFPAGESVVANNVGISNGGVIFTLHGYLTTN
jgi:hypothetical protein